MPLLAPLDTTMNPVEIIRKKRDGVSLSRGELEFFVRGYLNAELPSYQMSAFLMAVCCSGMTLEETITLTDIMIRSGVKVDLSSIPGIKVDKHSTGGVGDKVSIILAPMVAACGVPVPMISGRGLGHTGGTLDKLESIPGFRTDLSLEEYAGAVAETGIAMIGQTDEIAPADRMMYALRDVTGTVESIPLIAGSIMSKKVAEGIDALVLDVKTGNGAFMTSESDARALASTLIRVASNFGIRSIGFITDMSQPLGCAVGNWLELRECVECLRGAQVPDLMELTIALGGAMVMMGGRAGSIAEGSVLCGKAVASGAAWEKFLEMVRHQGGNDRVLHHPEEYPASRCTADVRASSAGFVTAIDAREIGLASVLLGAGRTKLDDAIDRKAGILLRKKVGEAVAAHDLLAEIRTDNEKVLSESVARIASAVTIGSVQPRHFPLIRAIIDEGGSRPWEESSRRGIGVF